MPQVTTISTAVLFTISFVVTGNSLPTEGDWSPVVSPTSEVFNTSDSAKNLEEIPEHTAEEGRSTSSWWDSAEFRVVSKTIDDCFNEVDGPSCIKRKVVTFLDGVSKMRRIPLFGGLAMEKQPGDEKLSEIPLTEERLEASLPRDLSQKEDSLNQMLFEKLSNIFYDRSLVLESSTKEEGRGKKKKLIGYALAGLGAAAVTMGAVFFKGIAALAFKALLVAKIAFVISSILAMKKLKDMKSDHRSMSGPWADRREYTTEQAHLLAYRGQLQRPVTYP